MTVEVEQTTEVAQETTEVADTKVEASGEGAVTDSESNDTSEADGNVAQSSAPVYTPNYKFKANQQEMEFDKVFHDAIKSAEQEKALRDLYEKSYGFENVKQKGEHYKNEYTNLNQEHQVLQSGLQKLNGFVQKKDFDSFFQALGVPELEVMKYVAMKLDLAQSPEKQQAYERSRTENLRMQDLEQQNRMYQEQLNQLSTGQRANELNYAFQRPEVSSVMQQFDARMGRVGAFRDEVIRRGQMYFATQGQDIPVDQAIAEVISLIGTSQAGDTAGVALPQVAKKPVIPNIQGRSSVSPAKRVYNSLDAIKQRAKEVNQQG